MKIQNQQTPTIRNFLNVCKKVVETNSCATFHGVLVDLFTAGGVVQVCNYLKKSKSPESYEKFLKLSGQHRIQKLISVTFESALSSHSNK